MGYESWLEILEIHSVRPHLLKIFSLAVVRKLVLDVVQ